MTGVKRSVWLVVAFLILFMAYAPATAGLLDGTNQCLSSRSLCRVAALGLIKGYPGGGYGLERPVSQMEAVVLFMRTSGFSLDKGQKKNSPGNTGVAPKVNWGQDYLDVAVEKKLLPDDMVSSFNADIPVTRAQMAAVLCKIIRLPVTEREPSESSCVFNDLSEAPAGYGPYIMAVNNFGFMKGCGDGTFRPARNLSRGEAVEILSRLVDRQLAQAQAERVLEGWIEGLPAKKPVTEIELQSLSGVRKIKLAASVKCFDGPMECRLEEAAGRAVEVVLNEKKQAACITLLDKRDGRKPDDKMIGTVKSLVMGKDSLLVLSDLDCIDRSLPLAWDAVLEDKGKKSAKGFQTLKSGIFVEVYLSGGEVKKVIPLATQSISGLVNKLTDLRLYLDGKGSSKGGKPLWFNHWDRARVVDKDGKRSFVKRGDKVNVVYLDPIPGEIDDEIPLEIVVTAGPALKKVKGIVKNTNTRYGSLKITLEKDKGFNVDDAVKVYWGNNPANFSDIAPGDTVELQVDGAGIVVKIEVL